MCTDNLIVTLQQDFPNTVPTLLRTAEKLANPYTWTLQYTSDTSDTLGSHNEEKQSSDAVEFGQVLKSHEFFFLLLLSMLFLIIFLKKFLFIITPLCQLTFL